MVIMIVLSMIVTLILILIMKKIQIITLTIII